MRFFRSAHRQVARFREGRDRQSDETFLTELGLPEDQDAARVGLAVRRAVAATGLVDPLYIRADETGDSLYVLPQWDSMDWVELTLILEDELGISISDAEAQKLTPVAERDFSVRKFARDALSLVQQHRSE